MRYGFWMAGLTAVLAVTGCKKQDTIEVPVEEPAPPPPAPTLVWSWGTVTYAGGDTGVGTLNMPLTVQNNGSASIVIRAWDVGVRTESGRVCIAREEQIEKAAGGGSTSFVLKANCDGSRLPEGDTLSLLGNIDYTLGGEAQRLAVAQDVDFRR